MHYIVRPGVVRTQICGVYLLIPDRKASEACPGVQRINFLLSAAVEELEKGHPVDNIYSFYRILSKKPEEEVRSKIDGILADLCDKGFLIRMEDDA